MNKIKIEEVVYLNRTMRVTISDFSAEKWALIFNDEKQADQDQVIKQLHTQLGEYLAKPETNHECKFRN